jgi:hypothetical protein
VRSVLLAAAAAIVPTAAYAQSTAGRAPEEVFGFAVAFESVAAGLDPSSCPSLEGGVGSVLSAFLAIPIWQAVSVEARFNAHLRGRIACGYGFALQPYPDGIYTDTSSDLGSGNFAALDARLRIAPPQSRLLATVGAGWVGGTKDVPYLVGSIGIRNGTRARLTTEVELRSYRVPWTTRTVEYQSGSFVQEVALRRYETWGTSFAVRLGVEIPVT